MSGQLINTPIRDVPPAVPVYNPYYFAVADLLKAIGPGRQITESTYDISWIARLGELDEQMSSQALTWLRQNQLEDGSWGAREFVYYHDRLVSTLAAIIALKKQGGPEDDFRIKRGAAIIEYLQNNLHFDPAGETIAFEMLIPGLLAEANQLGLIETAKTRFLNGLSRSREMKLANAPKHMISRYTTMAHSAEMVGPDGLHLLDFANLKEENGSLGNSPAATAFYLLHADPNDEEAWKFLHTAVTNGTAPYVFPIDTFEFGWTLWNLALVESLDEHFTKTLCQASLDFLESNWRPGKGIAACANLSFVDTDAAAITYDVLTHYGRSVDLEAILKRERDDHFICYELEANPSISTNIHTMGALRRAGFEANHPSVLKIRRFLQKRQFEGKYWLDKWQASPYYSTAHTIIVATGYDNGLVKNAVDWIISTQNWNGSWGFYDVATAEETAYCLQALSVWRKYGFSVPLDVLQRGAEWLKNHTDPPYPPLWIGKTLYTPTLVVRSAILSALMLVDEAKSVPVPDELWPVFAEDKMPAHVSA